jgi:predicted P-loop ATPase
MSELSAMNRSEVEAVKSFLTRRVDRYRPAYGRHVVTQPRRCVFLGSTNETHYLKDTTGNRRFWPVTVGEVQLDYLRRDRDQLFAEAVTAYHAGEPWHFTDAALIRQAEAEQAKRLEEDPWLQLIADYIKGRNETTTRALLDLVEIPDGKRAGGHAKRIGSIMRQLRWTRRIDKSGGEREALWTPRGK